jgi:hypothetical protein
MGGLGNILFQIAACISVSLKYNIPYCIPKHTLNDEVWKPYHFENVNYCNELANGVSCFYNEPTHAYKEIPKPTCDKFIISGYFQSILYFQDYLPEIRKAFGFDNLVTKKWVCSIHYRSGDYNLYPDKHPKITIEYIKNAIGYMRFAGYRKFLVFSDAIEEIKEIISSLPSIFHEGIVYNCSIGVDEIGDMKLMASCESNIIANSSFSLMSSILNNNPDKICIAPKIWFGEGNHHLNQKDIVPENYIRI